MMISALRSCSVRRWLSSCSFCTSSAKGLRFDFGPRFCGVKPWRMPALRSRRQVTRWDEYKPSRRSKAPISRDFLAWLVSAKICCLYSTVNLRRLALAITSGLGCGVGWKSGPALPAAGEGARTLDFLMLKSFSPCTLINDTRVSQLCWHRGSPKIRGHQLCNGETSFAKFGRTNAEGG